MKRTRFNRNTVASSRGSYVRKSHYLYIQEQLEERGIKAEINDIIEVSITIKPQTKYMVKCFGTTMYITKEQASKLNPELVIKF